MTKRWLRAARLPRCAGFCTTINVNSLFAGDGFTRHPDNPDEPVCAEYLVLNQPLEAFGSYCLIEFPVSAP